MTFVALPPDGLVPVRPPVELRTRVLAAAREAAARPAPGVLVALFGDRLLSGCAALIVVLAAACAAAGGGLAGGRAARGAAAVGDAALLEALRGEEIAVQVGAGPTLAEQWEALAPQLDLPASWPGRRAGARR